MGAIGASYWVASGFSYKAVAVVILLMALAGGVAGQVNETKKKKKEHLLNYLGTREEQ